MNRINGTEDLTVEDLIKYAYSEQIWLPEFQRPFVWEKNQIRLLIDSLYRNYTISSILTWEGGDELARRRVGGRVKDIEVPLGTANNKKLTYLLDGQQRTTALLIAFTDKDIYKGKNTMQKEVVNIWLDSEYNGEDPEEKWLLDTEKVLLPDPNDPNQAMRSLKDLGEKAIFLEFGHRYVKLKHTLEFDEDEVEGYFTDEIEGLRFSKKYNKKLNLLTANILARRVYHIEQKGTLEQVLDIFERINTRNTKLNIFDIMVAKTYRNFQDKGYFNLRDYYKIINHTGSVKKTYFENIEHLDLDAVKTVLTESDLLGLTSIMLNKEFKGKQILKLNTEQLMDNTKLLHDLHHQLLDFLKIHFKILPAELKYYRPMARLLAGVIAHFKDLSLSQETLLKTWFWNTLIKNRYPGSTNERIKKDYTLITDSQLTDAQKLTQILQGNTLNFDYMKVNDNTDNIKTIRAHYDAKTNRLYRAMILVLKSNSAKDFYSGFVVSNDNNSYKNALEEHHIFPTNSYIGKQLKAKYASRQDYNILNNIANISLITKTTNNKHISSKNPSVYITEFEQQYDQQGKLDEFKKIMASQFISEEMIEMLKNDNFEKFILARTKLLYEQIEKLCKVD